MLGRASPLAFHSCQVDLVASTALSIIETSGWMGVDFEDIGVGVGDGPEEDSVEELEDGGVEDEEETLRVVVLMVRERVFSPAIELEVDFDVVDDDDERSGILGAA